MPPGVYPTPPWKSILQASLQSGLEVSPTAGVCSEAYTQLATVGSDGVPRNRTVVFRGFAGNKPVHRVLPSFLKSQAVTNAQEKAIQQNKVATVGRFQSELLVFTTHLLSDKIHELEKNPQVEVCWFLPTTNEQFRLRGHMYMITSPTYYGHHVAATQSYQETSRYLQQFCWADPAPESDDSSIDWELLRLNHFFYMSPELRSSFICDYSGKPYTSLTSQEQRDCQSQLALTQLNLEQPDSSPSSSNHSTHRQVQQALQNFVLLILKPDYVDRCQLNTTPATRTVYVRQDRVPSAWHPSSERTPGLKESDLKPSSSQYLGGQPTGPAEISDHQKSDASSNHHQQWKSFSLVP
ncbi:hypothetical protein IWQ62_003664 [Dispira parvispora]|uniref:Pyridoxamine 5'-phosphate oxidase Alr4036 family FMN-binding domain-containing protein n=1 Tax=Dispira parvispora TaxID=1520584 RepID=A0A9W8E2P9_9FUNG|nr:hypothetical protein IWQ62_003664 [Dispira parvispora]